MSSNERLPAENGSSNEHEEIWSLGDDGRDVCKPPSPVIRMNELNKFSNKREYF